MPPKFTPDIQPTLLKILDQIHSDYVYGAFTLYGQVFPVLFQLLQVGSLTGALLHHIFPLLLRGIQFILCRFRSTLLTASPLLSFPLPTKMFQFGRFPLQKGASPKKEMGSPIR